MNRWTKTRTVVTAGLTGLLAAGLSACYGGGDGAAAQEEPAIDLAAEDRLDPRTAGADRKLQRRKHVVGVGHGHRRHAGTGAERAGQGAARPPAQSPPRAAFL